LGRGVENKEEKLWSDKTTKALISKYGYLKKFTRN
jgi:hypothetical protein